jgi:hypothetical protein
MRLQWAVIPVAAWLAGIVPADAGTRTATSAERAACEAKIQPRLDAIDAKMRSGYRAREGEALKEKRRKLVAERAACAKVNEVDS